MAPGVETRGVALARPLRRLPSLSSAQRLAVADVWRAFWLSRALVWLAGMAAVLAVGAAAEASPRLDSLWLTAPFDSEFANLLVAPAARFDSAWYLEIASFGYDVDARAAFFPLYPALVALVGAGIGSPLVAGIALSCAASLAGLYLLHRLTELELGPQTARATVWIVACAPVAFCLSAVYTEGLFLLLSVGAIYAGRLGRWRTAALVGVLAAATRSAGVLLVVPLALLYLYGPRADREPDLPARGWRPRYRPSADAAALAMIPAGLLAYLAYLGLATGDPLGAFTAQAEWERVLAPLAGIALGAWSALTGLAGLLGGIEIGQAATLGDTLAVQAGIGNLVLFAFLCLAAWLTVEAARRLPRAYLAYGITSLALPLSMPASDQPLMSLPRFMLVAFPLWIALAAWALERGVLRRVLAVSTAAMLVYTGLFAGWVTAP
jgi:hypothetical protein